MAPGGKWHTVTIVRAGETCEGTYIVEGKILTVVYNGHSRAIEVAGRRADTLAEQLLAELVKKHG